MSLAILKIETKYRFQSQYKSYYTKPDSSNGVLGYKLNTKSQDREISFSEKRLFYFFESVHIKTSPQGFSASMCDVGNWIFSKLGTFWEIAWKFFEFFQDFGGNFLDFSWIILRNFLEYFLGGILVCFERDWCFCQDFV